MLNPIEKFKRSILHLNTVLKFKNFPPGNLFFVSTVEKFQILEYRKVARLPQGPVTMLI